MAERSNALQREKTPANRFYKSTQNTTDFFFVKAHNKIINKYKIRRKLTKHKGSLLGEKIMWGSSCRSDKLLANMLLQYYMNHANKTHINCIFSQMNPLVSLPQLFRHVIVSPKKLSFFVLLQHFSVSWCFLKVQCVWPLRATIQKPEGCCHVFQLLSTYSCLSLALCEMMKDGRKTPGLFM